MHISRRHFFAGAAASAATLPFTDSLLALAATQRTRGGRGRAGEIRLSSNENPYGPLPSAMKAMQESLSLVHRYPDAHFDALWSAIAKTHGVRQEQVFLGCGSTDILRMAADSFTGPDRPLIMAAPSFEALGMYARRNKASVIQVPLRPDHAHDVERMLAEAQRAPSLVYICNPNNPTASMTPRADLERMFTKLPANATLFIDEAYHHFVQDPDYRSFADKPVDDPRIIVARTFSKVYGMAGMRVGYAVAHPQTMEKFGEHYVYDNPNVVGVIGATASLQDSAGLKMATERIVADRKRFVDEALRRRLKVIPSQANFVMFDSNRPVRSVIEHFGANGVRVGRPFPPFDTHVRVSLGTPEEMATFWKVWDSFPPSSDTRVSAILTESSH